MLIRLTGIATPPHYGDEVDPLDAHSRTYWGVFCRTCEEPVAFDAPPYRAGGLNGAHVKAGAISCAHGHYHIYFPRDFRFFFSETPISEMTMENNRAAYRATNAAIGIHVAPRA